MNKNVLLKVLLSTLIVFGFKAVSFAQLSPSGQLNVSVPGTISGCSKDTIFIEFTNTKGPSCPTPGAGGGNVTIEVDIPGDTIIKYVPSSVASLPAGAAEVSYVGKKLTLTIPVPSYGSTTRAYFLVASACNVTSLTPLPTFNVKATYPTGYPTPTESWVSTKMNTGIGSLLILDYLAPTEIRGFNTVYTNSGFYMSNVGYGDITEINVTVVKSDSLYSYSTGGNTIIPWFYRYNGNPTPGNPNSGGPNDAFTYIYQPLSAFPNYSATPNGDGTTTYKFTMKGGNYFGNDNKLTAGESFSVPSNYLRSPYTCQPDMFMRMTFEPVCGAAGPSCMAPSTFQRNYKVTAGTPIMGVSNANVTPYDGCGPKPASFNFRNTGVPDAARPEVSMAYNVNFSIPMGGLMKITNLKINGITIPTSLIVEDLSKPTSVVNLKIKDFNTLAGIGFVNNDADGKLDEMAPGTTMAVTFDYEVPCDLVCGVNLKYSIAAVTTYTDFCGKLAGASNSPIYSFGLSQIDAVTQKVPLPNFNTAYVNAGSPQGPLVGAAMDVLPGGAISTIPGEFTFNYTSNNINLLPATATLRINYSKTMEVVTPIRFLGKDLTLADFKKIGTENGITNGLANANAATYTGQSTNSTAGVVADKVNNTVDTDSALEYTIIAPTDVAKLFDGIKDTLKYSLTHISCDSFQTQNNNDGFSILFKINPTCTPAPSCELDLSCKKGFGYNYVEGCGVKPCYVNKDTIFRKGILGATADDLVTPVAQPIASPTKFYEGDTITNIHTIALNGDWPIMEPVGRYPNTANGFNYYFRWAYNIPTGTLPQAHPFLFMEDGSEVIVKDKSTGAIIGTAPIIFTDFIGWGSFEGTLNTRAPNQNLFGDNLTSGYPGSTSLAANYCLYGSHVIDVAACPYGTERYQDASSNMYFSMRNATKERMSDYYNLIFEKSLARAGIVFDPGYSKYEFAVKTNWRVNPDFPHTNSGDFNIVGGVNRYADANFPTGTYMTSCNNATSLGTAVTKDLSIKDPGAVYNSTCGLDIVNKLYLKSVSTNFFTNEVRVPYKLDSITVDLPVEYYVSSGTASFNYNNGTPTTAAVPTAIGSVTVLGATGGPTGHVKWTGALAGGEFNRMTDASGNTLTDSLRYTISNVLTDNFINNNYRFPVKYFLREENGTPFILIDTISIVEGKGDLTVRPLGGAVKVADGAGCVQQYMDLIVNNDSIYTAGYVILNAFGTASTIVTKIEDVGVYPDPIQVGDTGLVSSNRAYALIGSIAGGAPGQRIVRVFFTTSSCKDSIKIVSNFGCNYPAGNDVYANSTTKDSTYIVFESVAPQMMIGAITPKVNVVNLCDTSTVVVEITNTGAANLENITAGFKLPAGARYVTGSMQTNSTDQITTDSYFSLFPATSGLVSSGTAGDSLQLNVSTQLLLTGCSYGSTNYYYPGCGLVGPDSRLSTKRCDGVQNVSHLALNRVRIRFKIVYDACPASTSDQVGIAVRAENYCGTQTDGKAVVNLIYVGNAGPANNYSCSTNTAKPLAICAKPGQSQAIPDTLVIRNTGGFATSGPSLATDSLIITIPIDTNNFTVSDFIVNGVAVPLQLNAEGKYVLRTTVPAGIPVGGSVNMPISYNLKPKVANLCTIPAGDCASLSFFTEFKSIVSISCPAKGLACATLASVSRGQGLNARSLICCAAIGDKVWVDNDKDGIQDATGEPGVAGVTVNLYQNGADGLPGTPDDVLVGTTVTDAAGNYKFTDLVPSSGDPKLAYNLGFTPPPNYTFTQQVAGAGTDNQNNTNSDANPDASSTKFGRSGSIDLVANEYDSSVDAGLILPTPTTASVGNYVWFDTDKDGMQDATEKGISGVTVTLYDAAGKPVATTVSDADGKYLFDDVKPGTDYTVGFTPPVGLVPTTSTGPVSGTMNSDLLPSGLSAPFNVMAGDTIRYVDAGFIPQPADKASLGDKVFYDLNKDGVQDAGELGVGGVTVNLLNAAGAVIATTNTDELGNYVFNNLDAGTYSVEFIKPAGFDISPANVGTDDAKDSDADITTGKSAPVTLVAGEKNMTVDMGISKTSMTPLNSLGDKVWYDTDKDGNQDATEPGVAGVTVKLYNAAGVVIDSTVTDANGNYLFPGLPDGSYSVEFSNLPAGYGFSEEAALASTSAANSDANVSSGKTAPVALAGGTDYRDLDAGIYPKGEAGQTASLGNKVFYDLNNNGIQEPGETGVEGVTVTLRDAGPDGILGNGDDGPSKTTTTNGLGEYIFTGLPAGNYAVEFSDLPAGFNPSAANSGGDDSKDSDGGTVVSGKSTTTVYPLAAGEENLTVDLGIYNPFTNSIGNYVWIDVNGDGKQDATDVPVAGAMATLLNADGSTYDKDPATPGIQPYVTTTDATGAYLFTGLPDGTYKVAFSNIPKGYEFTTQNAPGTTPGDNSDANSSGVTGPVSVSGGGTNMTLDAGIKSTTKAALGNYVWNDEDGDGIQDPTEKGIAGVKVTVYDAAGNPVASTVTDADGKYFFPNLDPGTYTVGFENLPDGLVFSPSNVGADDKDSDVDPATGRTAPVTLAAGDVNLTVDAGVSPKPVGGLGNYVWFDDNNNGTQDATEKPAAGVIVTLKDATTGAVIATAVTDGDGYYNFPNLTPGTDKYVVTFSNLPLGYEFTTNTGTVVNGTNSDANPATGTTGTASVTAGTNNPNVDAGLVKPSAAIGDRVWLDKDKDGTQDAGEEGVGGVTVTLYDATGKVVGTTVTDALGNYKFSNLPAGQYSVGFTPPANYTFTPTYSSMDNNNNTNSDANAMPGSLFGRSGLITLSAGEYDSTIDAGLVLPTPTTASVGNYVWSDTDGDGVQDPTEKGISGVTVTLKDNTGKVIATTITDADGKYLFNDVPPGTGYTVSFTPPVGYIPTTQSGMVSSPTNSDMTPTGTTAPFNVMAGDTIRYVDAGFVPQDPNNASLGNRVWYDTNSDGIQDPGESGVEGITVNLLNASGAVIGTTKTDALGNYIFNNLPAGIYGVEFVKTTLPAGFTFTSPNQGADDGKDGDANPANGKTGLYSLLPGEKNMTVDAGVINATNTNSIGDKVWLDANKDGIQDPTEPGVGGVTVKLYNAAGMVVATTVTDKDGNYKFNNLPNGDYTVGFSNFPTGLELTGQNAPGSNPATGSDADVATGRTAPVTLSGNTNVTNLDAGLYPQGSPTQTASLGNKVFYDLDNDGVQDGGETGVPGVTVTLKDAVTGATIGTTTTNALGEYIFTGLPAGSYVVEFTNLPAGYATSPQNTGDDAKDSDGGMITSGKSVTAPVSLKAGEENLTVDLGLNKPNVNSIGNYVWIDQNKDGIQDATEVPVAGVMATLLNGDGTVYDKDPTTAGIQPYTTTTDANGNYLFTDLPDGSYKVVFSNLPNGYTITGKDATGDTKDSDVDPATKTTGVVTVGPANRVDTTLDAGIQTTTKAALGNYVWNDADGDGIQDPTEKGIAGVVVTVYNAAGMPVASTVTDADGKYFFPNLDPGTYTLGFGNLPAGMTFSPQTAGGDPTKDSNVDPLTGRTAPVTLVAGDVNLTVDAGVKPKPTGGLGDYVWFDDNADGIQDPNEKPAPGVTATLKNAAGDVIAVAVTDGDGKYNFPNLEPGDYTVTFTTLPQGFKFTNTSGADNNTNSDANPATGVTLPATVVAGQVNNKVDAGLVIITLANQSLSFTAVKAGNTSNLQFTVASVPTGSYFEIERSLDGINFENIGSLNSTSANTYNYVDATPNLNARNFYRVKMIESNGKTSTSEVRLVRFTKSKSIEVFPVPAKTSVNVVFNDVLTGKAVTLAIYSTSGQVVFKKQYGRANSSEIIDVTNFANGSYILQIITNNEVVETRKIQVIK